MSSPSFPLFPVCFLLFLSGFFLVSFCFPLFPLPGFVAPVQNQVQPSKTQDERCNETEPALFALRSFGRCACEHLCVAHGIAFNCSLPPTSVNSLHPASKCGSSRPLPATQRTHQLRTTLGVCSSRALARRADCCDGGRGLCGFADSSPTSFLSRPSDNVGNSVVRARRTCEFACPWLPTTGFYVAFSIGNCTRSAPWRKSAAAGHCAHGNLGQDALNAMPLTSTVCTGHLVIGQHASKVSPPLSS